MSDLFPDRCAALAKACSCEKTYPSLEEMVKDDSIEAIFVATDAPSHCRHCIDVLAHGKHVASAVPAGHCTPFRISRLDCQRRVTSSTTGSGRSPITAWLSMAQKIWK